MTIKKIPQSSFYRTDEEWRTSRYHFSFADYENPNRTHFGVLKALNDQYHNDDDIEFNQVSALDPITTPYKK